MPPWVSRQRFQQPGCSLHGHRAEGESLTGVFHFQQRLQPEQAAGTIAHQFQGPAAPLRFRQQRAGNPIRAKRHGSGVPGQKQTQAHLPASCPRASSSASRRAGSTRAWTPSSSRTEGEQAQLPRQ